MPPGRAPTPLQWDTEPPALPASGDVALVRAGTQLPGDWLAALAAVAASDTLIATVSPAALGAAPAALGPGGAVLSAQEGVPAQPPAWTLPPPRLEAPATACVLITRAALDLAGSEPDGNIGDWLAALAATLSAHGFVHVLAPGVLVGASVSGGGPAGPAARAALRHAGLGVAPLDVIVDARAVGRPTAGSQTHVIELLAALDRRDDVRVRALVPGDTTAAAQARLDALRRVQLLDHDVAIEQVLGDAPPPRADVAHRPQQVTAKEDIETLRHLADRLVITHQDLIDYRIADYHADREAYAAFRELSRRALAAADLACFFTEHAARDARADDLLVGTRAAVIPIGVDHVRAAAVGEPPVRPPFLLCLGADFAHKNRPFLLRLVQTLRDEHGLDLRVALAGPQVAHGSSRAEEAALLADDPDLAARVVALDSVDEPTKQALLAHAAAVAYPTLYEGFGLIPFEAAAHGTPCLFAPVTALQETLGGVEAPLVPWDLKASAARTAALLRDPQPQVEAIRAAGAQLTWDRCAEALVRAYTETVGRPVALAAGLTEQLERAERRATGWERRHWELVTAVGPAGMALVGPENPLLAEDERRTLTALLRRRASARPLRTTLRVLRRLAGR